ncbi:MAG: ABC transporter ATP-binding protein [Acetivibrionales bacterium]|jgi:ATP-binding cassette subfamily B protein|nr:ABC transporter ATP-binding protein [Clostridiaceae bacterium]
MSGPRSHRKPIAKPKNVGKILKRLLKYMSAYRYRLILVGVLIIISSLANIAGTYFLKPVINNYIVPFIGKENPDLLGLVSILTLMGSIYLLGVLASYLYARFMINISTGTLKRMRTDLFSHMESLPIKYFDTHTHGELMSRYTNDIDTLREMISQSLPNMFSSALTIIGVFIMMLVLSPVLTILVILMLVLMLNIIKMLGKKSGTYFQKQQKELGRVNGYIEEMIEGQKIVKVFSREKKIIDDFDKLNNELGVASTNAHTFANILMPIMGNLSYFQYALTAAIGAIMSINGYGIDLGTIASFLQFTRSFSHPITMMSQQLNSILSALAGAERIFEVLDEEPEKDDGYVELVKAQYNINCELVETESKEGIWAWKHPHGDGSITYTPVKGDVRFEDVTFGYEENKIVLKNISLYAKPGQKIAFVGSTGAGKTTITNLINRFYDVPDGKIRFDGININKIKKADLRRSLSMVLQDTHLFTDTVMENIRYGKLDATDEEVIKAAKLANAHSFIKHLPEGYNTVLTADGTNLSQGQRQLLAIARAAVADPPVLILDEATSSIDTRTEALIEKGMDTLMEGRTVFVIAHRLSTVRNSNAIMVLENGKIIERGDHDDLIANKGKYYQLYTGMFELS